VAAVRAETPVPPILLVDNYFNYFTEIEEHFQQRRGGALLLSTLDWALIETWKDTGIPLAAVLRGIDDTFDKYDQRPSKTKKVNSLAYCAQEVLAAAEDMKEAAVGVPSRRPDRGFDSAEIAAYLSRNAGALRSAKLPSRAGISPEIVANEVAGSLEGMASDLYQNGALARLEELERRLTVLEEKLFGVLMAAVADDELVSIRAQADRELAPYRSKMPATQIEQLQKQYVHKKLLEKYGLPRLSLFYL